MWNSLWQMIDVVSQTFVILQRISTYAKSMHMLAKSKKEFNVINFSDVQMHLKSSFFDESPPKLLQKTNLYS